MPNVYFLLQYYSTCHVLEQYESYLLYLFCVSQYIHNSEILKIYLDEKLLKK